MEKKKNYNPDKQSEKLSKKHKEEKKEKRYPNPKDPNEETGPPIKEMPHTGDPNHEEVFE